MHLADAARDLAFGTRCCVCARPGRVLCAGCTAALPRRGRLCWPTPTPPGLAVPFAAGAYDGALGVLVNQHKEHGALALAAPLGDVLAGVVEDLVGEVVGVPRDGLRLVPVPSRRAVVRSRGHDPLLRVAREAARRLRRRGIPVLVWPGLRASGAVADQAGLDAGQRAANLAGSMRARRPLRGTDLTTQVAEGHGAALVLVDDVLTTGSTAREAQRALEAAGHPVAGIATVAATRRRLPRTDGT